MNTIDFSSQDSAILKRHECFVETYGNNYDLDDLTSFLLEEEFYDVDNNPLFWDETNNSDEQGEEIFKQLRAYISKLISSTQSNEHITYGSDGVTYHHSYDHLTDVQLKQIFVATLKWSLEGGYVGVNAGVYMNKFEAFDGDVDFTDEQIERFMKCPIVRAFAKRVAEAGRPVHWPQVITMLEEPWQLRYKNMRAQMRDDARECPADKALETF